MNDQKATQPTVALTFERIQTDGIAELSSLIGDDSEGVARTFSNTAPGMPGVCSLQP